jgi:hypothetical protein
VTGKPRSKVAVPSVAEVIEQLVADIPSTDISQSEPSLSSYVPVKVTVSCAVSKDIADIVG